MLIKIFTTLESSKTQKNIKDEKGQEVEIIRVDKTLKEMMEEKPESRWDPKYWHPSYEKLIDELKKRNSAIKKLSDFISDKNIIQGDIARKHKGETYLSRSRYRLIEGNNFMFTGLDLDKCKYISEAQYNRLKKTIPKTGDILFVRSGSIGKLVGVTKNLDSFVINGHVNRVHDLENINSFYVLLFLLSKYGQSQLDRQQRGVAVVEINFNEFGRIYLPVVSRTVQQHIESEYKKMSKYHDRAMEAKKNGDEKEYKKNIEIAEKMLKDLIAKTEAVIRGERKDVT